MQYQTAKSELQLPPARLSGWLMLSEAAVMTALSFLLVYAIGG